MAGDTQPPAGSNPGDDDLIEIVYLSERDRDVDDDDIIDILRTAQTRNDAAGVSGLLLYDGRHFLQVIEGPRARVSRLYADILGDPRHINVRTVHEGLILKRVFEGWGMAYGRIAPNSEILSLARQQLVDGQAEDPDIIHVGALVNARFASNHRFTWTARG